jgi:murein L,D-transpeptidase YcbB/YkuD
LPKADTTTTAKTKKKKKTITIAGQVQKIYLHNEYRPLWVQKNYKPSEAANTFIRELEDMRWDGLHPERYNLSAILRLKSRLENIKHNVNDAIVFDTLLTHSYFAASKDLLMGVVSPQKVDSLWFLPNDTAWNAPKLLLESNGKYQSLNNFRSEMPVYAQMRSEYRRFATLESDSTFNRVLGNLQSYKSADSLFDSVLTYVVTTIVPGTSPAMDSAKKRQYLIKTYQQYAGLAPSGKADNETISHIASAPYYFKNSLRAAMERIRWMKRQPGDVYIVVNIPQMELFLEEKGANAMHMKVIVGRDERQTPSLGATMTNIVVNPWWEVPPTILRKDVIPGIRKSGEEYLAKKRLNAYDRRGNMVDATYVNEDNARDLTFRQPPGDENALGRIKFHMPNEWDIYLHDTPEKEIFDKPERLVSSGCIRVEQPREMALYILSRFEGKDYDSKLDAIINSNKNTWIALKRKIPVYVTYLTAFEDGTGKQIKYNRDVYGRDNELIALLAH